MVREKIVEIIDATDDKSEENRLKEESNINHGMTCCEEFGAKNPVVKLPCHKMKAIHSDCWTAHLMSHGVCCSCKEPSKHSDKGFANVKTNTRMNAFTTSPKLCTCHCIEKSTERRHSSDTDAVHKRCITTCGWGWR